MELLHLVSHRRCEVRVRVAESAGRDSRYKIEVLLLGECGCRLGRRAGEEKGGAMQRDDERSVHTSAGGVRETMTVFGSSSHETEEENIFQNVQNVCQQMEQRWPQTERTHSMIPNHRYKHICPKYWPPYLAIGVEELATLAAHDGERIPPVCALNVGVELVLRKWNACRGAGRHRRSRHHGQALASERPRTERESMHEKVACTYM